MKGRIFNIERYSTHDGPGIRTTVFVKGCPLTCAWCHNPEGLSCTSQIVYHLERCIGCGRCLSTCLEGAVAFGKNGFEINSELCMACGDCVSVCPTQARERLGEEVLPEEILERVIKDRLFFEESGGGVTFSGGEPLIQADFVSECLKLVKEKRLHTVLDTSGYASTEDVKKVLPFTDLFLFDIKGMDKERHRIYVGADNQLIHDNLHYIDSQNKPINIRLPIVPGVNDFPDEVAACGRMLSSLKNIVQVNLLPLHKMAAEKYRRLSKEYTIMDIPEPTDRQLMELKSILQNQGLRAKIKIGG